MNIIYFSFLILIIFCFLGKSKAKRNEEINYFLDNLTFNNDYEFVGNTEENRTYLSKELYSFLLEQMPDEFENGSIVFLDD